MPSPIKISIKLLFCHIICYKIRTLSASEHVSPTVVGSIGCYGALNEDSFEGLHLQRALQSVHLRLPLSSFQSWSFFPIQDLSFFSIAQLLSQLSFHLKQIGLLIYH